ncbi:alpha/beta fold hydrolase [Geodermatophilus sp. CPCC 206100]|uniref:alpha/beta fold hydrolase n=1 Tax=Geodermatophilus sp. CPCC 206100 TaxID=3020054 RepID=UPI003B0076D1
MDRVPSLTVRGADGTRLRAWCTGGSGTPVLLCNGLGAPASAWPEVVGRPDEFCVVGWDHRGLGDSERPRDPARVQVEDHVADARAVLDAFGLRSATAVGWSLGVNVAFELALEDPDRVDGVLAVAGVPGGSFSSLFAPFGVPRRLRPRAGRLGSRLLPLVGPLLPLITRTVQPWQAALLPAGGDDPAGRLGTVVQVAAEFAENDWSWFRHLAVAVADHAPLDLSPLTCPVTFLAGSSDPLVDVADVRAAAATVPGARYRELPAGHFLPLERPADMRRELRRLTGARTAA